MRKKRALSLSVAVLMSIMLSFATGLSGAKVAEADSVLPLSGQANVLTNIASLHQLVGFPSGGTFNGSLDVTTSTITGNMSLPQATVSTTVLGFVPMTAVIEVDQVSPVSGTVNLNALTLKVSTSFNIRIISATVFGFPVNLVGSSCITSSPVNVNMSGIISKTLSATVGGWYTIPQFKDCGLSTFLVNMLIPGSGNTILATISL